MAEEAPVLSKPGETFDKQEWARQHYTRDALETAIRVAYSIPFTRSKTTKSNDTLPKLPGLYLKDLSREERQLHELIIGERQALYAHSDADAYQPELEIRPNSKAQLLYTPDYFSVEQLIEIGELVRKLHFQFSTKQQELMGMLEEGSY